MGEFITPPSLPPTTYCRRLLIPNSPEWIGTVTGALMSLIYASEWKQTTGITSEDAANRAREMFNLYLESGNDGECGDMACCEDKAVIKRVNPDTGNIEISNDGGDTWRGAPDTIQSVIVNPVPPVTSGVAATKCDAATNVSGQVDLWISTVTNDFDTAVTLLEFGISVLEAILVAVSAVLSGGALSALELAVLPALGAALAATWGAGKAVFTAYWTTEIKEQILCAAYCNIGEDGSFTAGQFSNFWGKVNTDLPPGPAKMLFMGFLSNVGASGLNSMAATGYSADADCSDCDCDDCGATLYPAPDGAVLIGRPEPCVVDLQSVPSAGVNVMYAWWKSSGSFDANVCGVVSAIEVLSGSSVSYGYNDCGSGTLHYPDDPLNKCVSQLYFVSNIDPFIVRITYEACP